MGTLLSVGVDWLARTALASNPDSRDALNELGDKLLTDEMQKGNNGLYTSLYGYNGIKCGSVYAGNRIDSSIVQIRGKLAREYFQELAKVGDRTTRIDLECTVLVSPTNDYLAQEASQTALQARLKAKGNWDVRLWQGFGRGDTLYIGSMRSEHYGRLYDKGKESGVDEYQNCWRYEIAYRREKATYISNELLKRPNTNSTIISTVYDYFYKKGVHPQFSREGESPIIPPPEVPSGAEKTLIWIRRVIGPLFNRLIASGYGEKLVQALPMSELNKYVKIR